MTALVSPSHPPALRRAAGEPWPPYPRPALRPMQATDILVLRDRMPVVARRLAAAGVRPPPTGPVTELPSHHEKPTR